MQGFYTKSTVYAQHCTRRSRYISPHKKHPGTTAYLPPYSRKTHTTPLYTTWEKKCLMRYTSPHDTTLLLFALCLYTFMPAAHANTVGTRSFCDGYSSLCQRTCDQTIRNDLREVEAAIGSLELRDLIQQDQRPMLELEPQSFFEALAEQVTGQKEACYEACTSSMPTICHIPDESVV